AGQGAAAGAFRPPPAARGEPQLPAHGAQLRPLPSRLRPRDAGRRRRHLGRPRPRHPAHRHPQARREARRDPGGSLMPARRRKGDQKFVMISVVAERFAIHPQTLRLYEREGLIKPARSSGNTRLYDQEAIRRLETILTLTRDLGVNLAGVEVILNMKEQMEQMQVEVDRLLDYVKQEMLDRRVGIDRQHALVKVQSGPLTRRQA